MKKSEILRAMLDDSISFDKFYEMLYEADYGYWDGINSREIIEQYIKEMIDKGISVGHMLVALDNSDINDVNHFCIWLGNSLNTPIPIETKEELYNALTN